MKIKGTFHLKSDGKYYVKSSILPNEFELCEEDQEDRKRYLKESMSMEGEEVEIVIIKKFLPKEVKLIGKLIWGNPQYYLEDIIDAVNYGFNYRDNSQHSGEVPVGNILQWLMVKKKLTKIPEEWLKFKQTCTQEG